MWGIILILFSWNTGIPVEEIHSVELKTKRNELNIYFREYDNIEIKAEEPCLESQKLQDGRIELVFNEDAEVILPGNLSIQISTVSGDIYIISAETLSVYPSYLKINSVSGDVNIIRMPPVSFAFKTVNGDITVEGLLSVDTTLWSGHNGKIETVSGDIYLEPPLPYDLKIHTVSGDLHVEGKLVKKSKIQYRFETVSGETEIETEEDSNLVVRIARVPTKFGRLKGEKEVWVNPWNSEIGGPFIYNRVDGISLGLALSKGGRDRISLGARYGFSSKRWSLWLGMRKMIIGPLFIHTSLYSRTITPDFWKMSLMENTLAAFLVSKDYYDYYRKEGFDAGAGIILPAFHIKLSYASEKFISLDKKTDWSLFYPKRPMRENPTLLDGYYKFITTQADFSRHPFTINFLLRKSINTPDNEKVYTGLMRVGFKEKIKRDMLLVSIISGASNTEDFPFGFRLGGIGTLPGYSTNQFITDRFALLRADYWLKIGGIHAIFFFDAAKIGSFEEPVKADVGLGLSPFSDFSIRFVRNIEEEGEIRTYVRLSKRF